MAFNQKLYEMGSMDLYNTYVVALNPHKLGRMPSSLLTVHGKKLTQQKRLSKKKK